MAAVIAWAAANCSADQTNLVRNLEIQLAGVQQGDATTIKNTTTISVDKAFIDTGDVIKALGVATGNSFSRRARLVVVTPIPSGASTIEVRDGGNQIDVSAFFVQSHVSGTVGRSTSNTKTGRSEGSNYSYQEFSLVDPGGYTPLPLHYSVRGIGVENFSTPAIPGPRSELRADVAGAGDDNGALLILQGNIRVTGQSVEVVTGGGGPPA